ncbi:hypothetical protein P3T76_009661 [Phytophthora citrophthora]|uniref:Uncharacterized protein n=1 Tax=Phytophthora citrophthora TaxID=4793 RepID=A0AAD9GGC2_9STRA|nr:hypothetical protein P3T76_009661 [Phytophthora citrophthora]
MTYMWKPVSKRLQHSLNPHSALVPFPPQFYSAELLADWVFNVAKYRPLQLNLESCEDSEEVCEAVLRKFQRWPDTKMAQTSAHYDELIQKTNQDCQEQVQLYIQDVRGKLNAGANALFWLDLLQPLTHQASMPREEVQEVLIALLEELKSVEGVFEQLMKTNERFWRVLTLPLRLEPLFRGVSMLALCGHAASANEAMQLLAMFAEQYTAFPRNKRALLVGLSIVASVGTFPISDLSGLGELLEPFRDQLSKPLTLMVPDWIAGVDRVLSVLEESLTNQWASCERAPLEEELKLAMEKIVQEAFKRLSHALRTNQLYAMRKGSSVNQTCPNINIVREGKALFMQLNR